MTPKQQYYKNLADTMISHLEKRGFEANFVPDRQAALEAIMPYLKIQERHTSRYNPYVSRKETGSEACS